MTLQEQIIEKQNEINHHLKSIIIELYGQCNDDKTNQLESELSALKAQAEQSPANSDKELYEKVYIRSEADLPKDDKRYIGFHKQSGLMKFYIRKGFSDESWLLQYFDWYLRPVEAEQDSCKSAKSKNGKHLIVSSDPDGMYCGLCGKDIKPSEQF